MASDQQFWLVYMYASKILHELRFTKLFLWVKHEIQARISFLDIDFFILM